MISLFFLYSSALYLLLFRPVNAHFHPRNTNTDKVTEIPLPALTLRPQAAGYNFDLQSALPPASNTLSQLAVLPTNCAEYLDPGNSSAECASTMTATAVTYEDCGDPFTVCRCADANMTMDTIVDRLGRVPVGLRRFVATVVILGGETQAYTNLSTGDVHLFGDCAMDTWIHEVRRRSYPLGVSLLTGSQATHSFDSASRLLSSSLGWGQAIGNDSCAPDQYSLTNRVEVSHNLAKCPG